MKAEKIITYIQEIDVDVIGITLLSVEEARKVDENIRYIDEYWWLRSPGFDDFLAAVVGGDGYVYDFGSNAGNKYGLRPALKISNMESSNLGVGDKFTLADEQWIVISENTALCRRVVGKTEFRKDWKKPDANDYEKSDIKAWLEKWATERGIICRMAE